MDYLAEYGLFLAKALTLVLLLLLTVAGLGWLGRRGREGRGWLEVRSLNRHYEDLAKALEQRRESGWRGRLRWRRRAREETETRPRLFVLDFQGDLKASAVAALREEVSAVLQVAEAGDEVLLRLESPGGMVTGYGLAASQLERLRRAGIPLTVAVDKIAASGGYLMACVGQRILAAPFAVLGSIGVVAQVPNLHRFLERRDIDVEVFTAGQYKRTVTVFGENTPERKAKFQQELEAMHALFKGFVARHRPELDLERVATGEAWLGEEALTLGLVDELGTSDDFLLQRRHSHRLLALRYHPPRRGRNWPWRSLAWGAEVLRRLRGGA